MATKKKVEQKEPQAEAVSGKGQNALTVYFFAIVNGKKFPAQQTLTCDNVEDFTKLLPDFYAAFGASDEDDFVTYEPRNIGPAAPRAAASRGSQSAQAPQERVLGPECPFHGVPTTQKQGRNGPFFSCSKRREDGSWCNWTPEEQRK